MDIIITMLGARGVGKTSLLASMYEQFEQVSHDMNLQLYIREIDQISLLQESLGKLKSADNIFELTVGIDGSASPTQFDFGLDKKHQNPRKKRKTPIQLSFHDYPGGWFLPSSSSQEKQEVLDYIKKSDVIALAIDSAALMEENGRFHDQINTPMQIREFLKNALDINDKKLILLVPIKCESYVKTDKDARLLLKSIKKSYSSLLQMLSAYESLVVASTPVQTLGNVRFSRIESENAHPCFYFRKDEVAAPYKPRNVEQPLCYTLSFVIKKYLEDKHALTRWVDRLLKRDVAFQEALQSLAALRKVNTDGFEVIQGRHLIN